MIGKITVFLSFKQFKAEDIFNTNETKLFYQHLLDRTHVFKNDKYTGGKLYKERLTVLVTASMVGEKLLPLVIGKSANPKCFKNIKKLASKTLRNLTRKFG